MYKDAAAFDTLRSLGFAGMSGSYAAVGTSTTFAIAIMNFKNFTNGDVIISTDGVHDMLYIPANSFSLYDIRTNAPRATDLLFPIGTQFFAKQGTTAATSGTFYIELVIVKQLGS